jgi:hypothetical protein
MATSYKYDNPGRDSDGDGLTDEFERRVLGTDPYKRDTDADGINDNRERDFGTNPLSGDSDGDTVGDLREVIVGLDPRNLDTDGDGKRDDVNLRSGQPVYIPDDDRDGQPNWVEDVNSGQDSDGDGLTDTEERWLRTNPDEVYTAGPTADLDDVIIGIDPRTADGRPATAAPHAPSDAPVLSPAVGPSQNPDADVTPTDPEPTTPTWEEDPQVCVAPEPEPEVCVAPEPEPEVCYAPEPDSYDSMATP